MARDEKRSGRTVVGFCHRLPTKGQFPRTPTIIGGNVRAIATLRVLLVAVFAGKQAPAQSELAVDCVEQLRPSAQPDESQHSMQSACAWGRWRLICPGMRSSERWVWLL